MESLSDSPSSGVATVRLYCPPGTAARSQVMLSAAEAVTLQTADPTVTVGAEPKLDPKSCKPYEFFFFASLPTQMAVLNTACIND